MDEMGLSTTVYTLWCTVHAHVICFLACHARIMDSQENNKHFSVLSYVEGDVSKN